MAHHPSPITRYPNATVLFIVVVSMLLATQGLNMTDDGFLLTTYQQVFSDPSSVSYFFLYYWVDVLGGLWNSLFSSWGIYGFRLLECLVMGLTVFVAIRLLRHYFHLRIVCIGILLVFLLTKEVGVLHYNTLSALLTLVVVAFLMKALTMHRWLYMLLAGIAMGMNIFVRLPNAALSVLILVLIPYYIYSHQGKRTLIFLVTAIMGTCLGIGVTWLSMLLFGHTDSFLFALQSGFSIFGHADSSHSSHHLLSVIANDVWMMAKQFLLFGFILLPMTRWFSPLSSAFQNKWTARVVGIVFILIALILFKHFLYPVYALNMLVVVACIYTAVHRKDEPAVVYLAVLSLLTTLFMPFGCDFGLLNMQQCSLWLGGAFVVYMFFNLLSESTNNRSEAKRMGSYLLGIYAVVLVGKMLYGYAYPVFYENGNRLQTRYSVNWPHCNVLTTQENAQELVTVLQQMSQVVKADEEVLVYPYSPMLYYLTSTRPYLRNPLPWIYNDQLFQEQLLESEKRATKLPVVVWQKSRLNAWKTPDADWNNPNSPETYDSHTQQKRYLLDYLQRNHYRVVWQNQLFQILSPQ